MKHKEERTKIASLIKQARLSAGLKQEELADLIGHKRRWSGVSDWENEKVAPSAVSLLLIAEACGKVLTFSDK